MSRNSRRTSANPPTPQAPAPPRGLPTQNNENPFGISFVVPTEVVSLPTKGKFYDKNSSLYGCETLEIKHLTAKEEDLLANQSFIEDGTIFDRLLSAILIDRSVNVSELIETDKNALLIASRITGYGPEYSMRMPCQACGKVAEFVFDLEKREIEDSIPEGVSFEEDTGLFVFVLPKTELETKVRILNGNDLQYLDKQKRKAEELGLDHNTSISLFRMAVAEVKGISDPSLLNTLFEALPALDSRKLRSVINSVTPRVSTKQSVACGSCAEETESEVPFTLGFFWPDL